MQSVPHEPPDQPKRDDLEEQQGRRRGSRGGGEAGSRPPFQGRLKTTPTCSPAATTRGSWARRRCLTGTATRCWRERRRCGQRAPRAARARSPSQPTRTTTLPRCCRAGTSHHHVLQNLSMAGKEDPPVTIRNRSLSCKDLSSVM